MQIVCREYYDKEKGHKSYLVFDKAGDTLLVKRRDENDKIVCDREFDLTALQESYGTKGVFLSCYMLASQKEFSELIQRVPEVDFEKYKHAYALNNEELVFGIWFKTATDFTVISPNIPVMQESNVMLAPKNAKATEMIMAVDESYRSHYKKIMAKRKLLSNVDANNSLSGLEPQVDILTKLVLKIINSNSELLAEVRKEMPLYDDFVSVYNEDTLLNLKTVDSCIEEIREQKGKIRREQTKYYETRE